MRKLQLLLALALLGNAKSALAQDESEINHAYQKAADGLTQYKAGRYAEALDNYTQAYAIVHLPALAVHIARANVKLGRFVAAKQFYDEALNLPDGVGDPQIQARARVEARTEGQALLTRIPRLVFHISGVSALGVTIRVDGAAIPGEANAGGWFVDPGSHQVLVSFGTQEQGRWIAVSEGEQRELAFTFVPAPTNPSSQQPAPGIEESGKAPSTTRTLAWVGLGIGAAGMLVWGATGLVALEKSNQLEELHCGGATQSPCPVSELDSYNKWKTASTVGFYTGAAALLTGATLYLVAPREKKSRGATGSVVPWLGFRSAGVEGHF